MNEAHDLELDLELDLDLKVTLPGLLAMHDQCHTNLDGDMLACDL